MDLKNIIPIRTHTHLINTSNKFGATLGLKMCIKAKSASENQLL